MSQQDVTSSGTKKSVPVIEAAAQFQGIEADPNPVFGRSPFPAAVSKPEEPKAPAITKEQGANVKLSADAADLALPEGQLNIGTCGMKIPSKAQQLAGFRLSKEQAARLVAQFRQFKFFVDKGQAAPPVKIGE